MKTTWQRIAALAASLTIAASSLVVSTTTAGADVDVYITPGTHTINGREWRTECEPYSATERCRTEIKATVVSETNGVFTPKTDWAFNNLTYKASPRSLWKNNRLGGNGQVGGKASWTSADGRKWRTECDTALTGNGGCRSFIVASVIETTKDAAGNTAYKWVTKELFNNMVRFTQPSPAPEPTTPAKPTPKPTPPVTPKPTPPVTPKPTPPVTPPVTPTPDPTTPPTTPADPGDLSFITDPNLRTCIDRRIQAENVADYTKLSQLDCSYLDITNLDGIQHLTNLTALYLDSNQISDITALSNLTNLTELWMGGNQISDITALSNLTNLEWLYLADNPVTNPEVLQPLADGGTYIDILN